MDFTSAHLWKAFLQMPDTAEILFDEMPRFMYFVKDSDLKFVRMNQQLVEKIGLPKSEIIGKTDYDLFPETIAEAYRHDDEQIIETKKAIINKVELVPASHGQVDWSLTTKIPLIGPGDSVIAIIGVTRAFSSSDTAQESSKELNRVIQHIKTHYGEKISVAELAKMASFSVSALERRFKKIFHVSPSQYILNTRIQNACHFLSQTSKDLVSIAIECGFYDQSHFSHQFSKSMNITPSKYRKLYRI